MLVPGPNKATLYTGHLNYNPSLRFSLNANLSKLLEAQVPKLLWIPDSFPHLNPIPQRKKQPFLNLQRSSKNKCMADHSSVTAFLFNTRVTLLTRSHCTSSEGTESSMSTINFILNDNLINGSVRKLALI